MNFIEKMIQKGMELNDPILTNDLTKIKEQSVGLKPKEIAKKLESAFRTANYNGTYNAFVLERECYYFIYN